MPNIDELGLDSSWLESWIDYNINIKNIYIPWTRALEFSVKFDFVWGLKPAPALSFFFPFNYSFKGLNKTWLRFSVVYKIRYTVYLNISTNIKDKQIMFIWVGQKSLNWVLLAFHRAFLLKELYMRETRHLDICLNRLLKSLSD